MQINKLTINIKKNHYILFYRTRIKNKTNKQVYINGNNISNTNSTKFLGVIIDSKLNWCEHIQYIKNKISKSNGILYKIRHFLDKNTLRNMYFTFVYPYLIYCIEVWGNAFDSHLTPLINLQKKTIRTITFSYYLEHTAPIFKKLNILSFKKLVTQRISLIMYKRHLNILPSPIVNLFSMNNTQHNYNTRQHTHFRTQIGKTEHVYKLLSFHGANIWNHMSNKISLDVSYVCYKKLSKKYIQDNDIIYRVT